MQTAFAAPFGHAVTHGPCVEELRYEMASNAVTPDCRDSGNVTSMSLSCITWRRVCSSERFTAKSTAAALPTQGATESTMTDYPIPYHVEVIRVDRSSVVGKHLAVSMPIWPQQRQPFPIVAASTGGSKSGADLQAPPHSDQLEN
jgi:hypothetical protein